ncbi:MAG: ATP-binding protein [Acidimicrobiales bacterium]
MVAANSGSACPDGASLPRVDPAIDAMGCPVLVGRQAELKRLLAGLKSAGAGQGRTLIISGDSGLGKTRLCRELASAAQSRGFDVHLGRASAAGSALAFHPLHGRAGTSPPLGAESSPAGVAQAVLALENARQGTVVLLEDLHLADSFTLATLEILTDRIAAYPVLVVATLRPDPISAATRLSEFLHSRRTAGLIRLAPLSSPDVATMATQCLARWSRQALPVPVFEALAKWAGGVPFLVEELLEAWWISGQLQLCPEGWEARDPLPPVIPPLVALEVGDTLASLDFVTARVARTAAVLGPEFAWRTVADVVGGDEEMILTAFRKMQEVALLATPSGRPSATLRFRSDLVRETIRSSLGPAEAQVLCRDLFELVRTMDPRAVSGWADIVCSLALGAEEVVGAAQMLVTAGRAALAKGALSCGSVILERAMTLSGAEPGLTEHLEEAADLLIEVLATMGRVEEAQTLGAQVLVSLPSCGPGVARRVRIQMSLTRAAICASRWNTASAALDATRRLVGGRADESMSAVACLAAQVALGRGHLDEAKRLAVSVTGLGQAHRSPATDCEALEILGRCWRLRDADKAEGYFLQALAVAEEHDLPVMRCRVLHSLGTIDMLDGRPMNRLQSAQRLAQDRGLPALGTLIDLDLASWHGLAFDTSATLDCAGRSADSAARLGLRELEAKALCLIGLAHAQRDSRCEMEAAVEGALALAPDRPDVLGAVWGECRALLSLIENDCRRAHHELETAMTHLRRLPTTMPSPCRGLWCLIRVVTEDRPSAAVEELADSGATVHRLNRGCLALSRAVLAGRNDDIEVSERETHSAAEAFGHWDWWWHLALGLVAGEAIKSGWGDPVGWSRQALTFFSERGQPRLAAGCRNVLSEAGVPVPRRGRNVFLGVPHKFASRGVTAREMDVMVLVAQGGSNREIAERLFLSPRTVERHVSSLCQKLDLRSRTQLVAAGARSVASTSLLVRPPS